MIERSDNVELESLRLTLQRLQQTSSSSRDTIEMAGLKQILLNRIADLEVIGALTPAAAQFDESPNADVLTALSSDTGDDEPQGGEGTIPLNKLD